MNLFVVLQEDEVLQWLLVTFLRQAGQSTKLN